MSAMNSDISTLLNGWDYEPSRVKARWIVGRDGRLKIQLRLDLGVLQMEVEGRPDGRRPKGHASWLEYYQSFKPVGGEFPREAVPDKAGCNDLQQEALQYYYRYLAFQALGNHDGVVADTTHNLEIVKLVEQRLGDERLVWPFLQFYPYIRMMQARAMAEKGLATDQFDEARAILQEAVGDIRLFWTQHGDGEAPPDAPELEALTDLLGRLHDRRPRSPREKLNEQLERAIASEDFEQAASLRDQLRHLTGR